jgi:hypothetical protein
MRRRDFTAGLMLIGAIAVARAQQSGKVWRVGQVIE